MPRLNLEDSYVFLPAQILLLVAGVSDEQAPFLALVRPHLPRLSALARRLAAPWDADDLLQHTLLAAWRARHRLAAAASPGAYLARTMYNTFLSDRRKQIVRIRASASQATVSATVSEASRVAGAGEPGAVEGRIDARRGLTAVTRLAPHHRQVIELVAIRGYSHREVTEHTGIPTGTLMSRLHRARRRIRPIPPAPARCATRAAS